MKARVDIPEDGPKDVVTILEDFNRRKRMAELVKYSGTFSDRFPTNDEIESADDQRDRSLHGRHRR